MLGAVVTSFFICLFPFRLMTLINVDQTYMSNEAYFIMLNFCRVMIYLNSAINPILYNLMSSKFRDGFLRLFKLRSVSRQGTVTSSSVTTATNFTSSSSSSAPHKSTYRLPKAQDLWIFKNFLKIIAKKFTIIDACLNVNVFKLYIYI